MGQIGSIIAATGGPVVSYTERLLEGVTQKNYARLAGGVETNHPAFILGHLCLYPVRVHEYLGADPAGVAAPDGYAALFEPGAACHDDPDGSRYPSLEELQSHFLSAQRSACALIQEAGDDKLLGENPREGRMRELFPTAAAMFSFFLCGHPMMHLGQWSAWRRMQGLAPA